MHVHVEPPLWHRQLLTAHTVTHPHGMLPLHGDSLHPRPLVGFVPRARLCVFVCLNVRVVIRARLSSTLSFTLRFNSFLAMYPVHKECDYAC